MLFSFGVTVAVVTRHTHPASRAMMRAYRASLHTCMLKHTEAYHVEVTHLLSHVKWPYKYSIFLCPYHMLHWSNPKRCDFMSCRRGTEGASVGLEREAPEWQVSAFGASKILFRATLLLVVLSSSSWMLAATPRGIIIHKRARGLP